MSYTFILQCSTDFLRSVFTKINTAAQNDICGHCLKKHKYLINGGGNFSTDAILLSYNLRRKQSHHRVNKTGNKNKKKFFTELVEVSSFQSHKTTMKIRQLKPNDLKAFVDNPGMTFGKKEISNSYSYNCIRSYDPSLVIPIENVVKFVESLIEQNTLLNKNNINSDCDFNNHQNPKYNKFLTNDKKDNVTILPPDLVKGSDISAMKFNNTLQSEIAKNASLTNTSMANIENRESLESYRSDNFEDLLLEHKSGKKLQLDSLSQEYDFVRVLQSYIDVAATNGNLEEAFEIMKTCRMKKLWTDALKILKINDVYNLLLNVFANDWSKICEIREWMKSDKVPCNYETYAILLGTLGKHKEKYGTDWASWKNKVNSILQEMENMNISKNKLFTNPQFSYGECKYILKSIQAIYPHFEMPPYTIKLKSKCPLLNDLNDGFPNLESPAKGVMSFEALKNCIDKQIDVEKKFNIPVKAINVHGVALCTTEEKQKYQNWVAKWREQVHEGFMRSLKLVDENKKAFGTFNLAIYLKCLPPEVYVEAMMNSVKNLVEYSGGFSPTLRTLHKIIGEHIHERYQIVKKEKLGIITNTKETFKKYCDWYCNPNGPAKNSRQQWQLLFQECGDVLDMKEIVWPDTVKLSIGKFLYEIILKKIKININECGKERLIPVFYSIIRREYMMAVEEIKCHPSVGRLFQKCGFDIINFEAIQIPMVCPPKPWKSVSHGGYLISPVEFTRSPREFGQKKLNFNKINPLQLYPNFDSLNSLQMVAWKINQPILDIVLNIFENGGCDDLDVPEYPSLNSVAVNITPDMTAEQRLFEFRKKKVFIMDKQNKYGLWCEALYRLSLANHFRSDIFWLPQNFDFRGRVYPVPPYLNHLGGDLFRSLLIFAKGKPLGPKGLDWLKIHAINLTGTQKKASNEERLSYANQILPEILDSAERPLEGRKWWTKSENRWQTLAACMEIKKAVECDNPEQWVCYFPVHQDGSCNGLQHYAALGRDCIGAKSVNLSPCNRPQDVYNAVTQLIENERAEDAKNGVEIARFLEGFVRRKVIKQTIMTTVYGVTYFGARLQIAGQLEDISDFPKKYVWLAADYLTIKTFKCLKQMFTSAKEIQDWFIQCAEVICEQKDFVQWVSPLGLPILQPYAKKPDFKKKNFKECLESPNKMKQKNAFPPNFVHSLDSSHMMLTSQYCEQANVTFASIHDCFWTHPCSVEIMNKICREQFVALHSQSILKDLSDFFINNYIKSNCGNSKALDVFSRVPKTGDFDLNEIYKSVYFFS